MKSIIILQCFVTLLYVTRVTGEKYDGKLNNSEDFYKNHQAPLNTNTKDPGNYIIGNTTLPIQYDLYIKPYLFNPLQQMFTFDGTVVIRVKVIEPTKQIYLHSWNLKVDSNKLKVVSVKNNASLSKYAVYLPNSDKHSLTISLTQTVYENELLDVHINYTGSLINEGMYGFSASNYTDESGFLEAVAITRLSPTAGRRLMPCIDQPDRKVPITLHVAREPYYNVLSNMPVASEGDPVEGLPRWVWVHFEPTPPMPTNLLSIAVHKFSSITNAVDNRFKVWSQRPQDGEYANEIIPEIIKYLEQYTNMPYLLPKYDQIAIPNFDVESVESWGLIPYLESSLLYNAAVDTIWQKNKITKFVANEAAHQWFGNVVTPKWWSSLWLSEGFSRYFEYFAIHGIDPAMQMDQQFLKDVMYSAFEADVIDSHPLFDEKVDSPLAIYNHFDVITHNKGASIVRFMVNYMGEENFITGIQEYLSELMYENAEQKDLFLYLEQYAPQAPSGFVKLMDTWTLQLGFPLLTVIRNYEENTINILQARFNNNGTEQWIIPLTMTSGDNPDFSDLSVKAWFMQNKPEITLESWQSPAPDQWFLLNVKQTGFYRVKYDTTNYALLTDFMSTPGNALIVDPLNRIQIMDDAFSLSVIHSIDYVTALSTTKYLDQEYLLTPWMLATDHLMFIRDRMFSTEHGVNITQDYMQRKINLLFETVNGFTVSENDDHATILSRSFVTRWACDWEHDACNTQGSDLFQLWLDTQDPDTNNPIAVDLRSAAYCAGQRRGGRQQYEFLVERFLSTQTTNEENNIIRAMGCASDVTLLQSYLSDSLVIFDAVALDVLEAVYSNPIGVDVALDFLIENWQILEDLYEGGVGIGFINLSSKLNTLEHYVAVSVFLQSNWDTLGTQNRVMISDTLGKVYENYLWNEEYLDAIVQFFETN